MDKIDFVLPWVDGSDSAWIKQRNEYLGIKNDQTQDSRFRDFCDMGAYPFLAEYRSSETDSCKTRGLYSEAVSAHIQQSSH